MKTLLLLVLLIPSLARASSVVDDVKESLEKDVAQAEYDLKQIHFYTDDYKPEERLIAIYRAAKAQAEKDRRNPISPNTPTDLRAELDHILSLRAPREIRQQYRYDIEEAFRHYDYHLKKLDGIALKPDALGDAPKRMQAVRDEIDGKAPAKAESKPEEKAPATTKPAIVLKKTDGSTINASSAIETDNEWILKTDKGMVTVKKSDVASIEK